VVTITFGALIIQYHLWGFFTNIAIFFQSIKKAPAAADAFVCQVHTIRAGKENGNAPVALVKSGK